MKNLFILYHAISISIFALIISYLFIIPVASDRAESDSPVSKKQREDQDTTGNVYRYVLCIINVNF